jgi:hypothetical protein
METQQKVLELFQEEPSRWGLRGDPFLWREMKGIIDRYEYPKTEREFTALLGQIYQQLTGVSLTSHDPAFVERYSHGGISSGYVSPQFWMEQAMPILLARYCESK